MNERKVYYDFKYYSFFLKCKLVYVFLFKGKMLVVYRVIGNLRCVLLCWLGGVSKFGDFGRVLVWVEVLVLDLFFKRLFCIVDVLFMVRAI